MMMSLLTCTPCVPSRTTLKSLSGFGATAWAATLNEPPGYAFGLRSKIEGTRGPPSLLSQRALVMPSRLIGLVGTLSFRVLLEAFIFVLIYADDLHLIGAGKDRWLNIWMTLALFCVQGTPFSDHKWRGGLQVDWVGYWIDYTRFRLGLLKRDVNGSFLPSRAWSPVGGWWMSAASTSYMVGLASCLVLLWIRPFLAPGYAWLSVIHRGAVLSLPNLVRCTLLFIVGKLKKGARTYPSGLVEKDLGEIFRTDAACNDDSIVLGGWFLHRGGQKSSAPWFQLVLSRTEVPWLFNEGGSSWASTSAELWRP